VRPDAAQTSGNYRFQAPPPNDWRFDPKITEFSGRLLYDRKVVDASGIGNTNQQNVPLTGLNVELQSGPDTYATALVDSNGDFRIRGLALPSAAVGTVVVVPRTPACTVLTQPGGVIANFIIRDNVSFGADLLLGTFVIANNNDPTGRGRIPLNIALGVQKAFDYARIRTTDTIQPIEVYYDPTSIEETQYNKQGASTPPNLRISGTNVNPDGWDLPVIIREYGRHVLASIARPTTAAASNVFDGVSDEENAFAAGWGFYLYTAMSVTDGSLPLEFFDGLSPNSTEVINLENPTITTPKGPAVTAWCMAALYDLVDPANEGWDVVDGMASPEIDKPFQVADSMTVAPTSYTFFRAWGDRGFVGGPMARIFIHHGIVADDDDEPNDDNTETTQISGFGFIRPHRLLNNYNEDWYTFSVDRAATSLTVDVVYNPTIYNSQFSLEIQDPSGNVIASGSMLTIGGPMRAVTGAIEAGTYRARVRHDALDPLGDYTLQAFIPMIMSSEPFQPWTVNRPYEVPVGVVGGIPPYTLTVDKVFKAPPGLTFDGVNRVVTGVPTEAGVFNFVLSSVDAATPPQIASVPKPIEFVVNPEMKLGLQEFFGFPLNVDLDRAGVHTGGTPPYTYQQDSG
jgi:hypothetical protein